MKGRDVSEERLAEVEAGVALRARKLRFSKKPKTEVKWRQEVNGRLVDENLDAETASLSRRKNLPEEVEPGVTYRNVELRSAGGVRVTAEDPGEAEN